MQQLVGNTHLIAGGMEVVDELFALLRAENIAIENNPDIFIREYKQFGIDEALDLHMRSRSRGLNGRRVFVVVSAGMTSEAQNALLKTIEEPVADALFFFCVQSPQTLLSTVRSRSQILSLSRDTVTRGVIDVREFLQSLPARRIELLKPLLGKDTDEKRDIGAIIEFLADLERSVTFYKDPQKQRTFLETIYAARKYMTDKGALVKPLLESVALLAPAL